MKNNEFIEYSEGKHFHKFHHKDTLYGMDTEVLFLPKQIHHSEEEFKRKLKKEFPYTTLSCYNWEKLPINPNERNTSPEEK